MNTNGKVNQYYEQYKNFIKENNMPTIYPVIIPKSESERKNSFAYVKAELLRKNIVPIMYKESAFEYNEVFSKSIFFHEFTHIYDANFKFKDLNEEDFITVMNTYSEYHASQIEMGIQFDMKNKNDIFRLHSKIKQKNFLFYKDKIKDIKSYILVPYQEIVITLNQTKKNFSKLSNDELASLYKIIEKNIFYYYGKYDFYCKYSELKMEDMLLKSCSQFKNEISHMHNLVKSKNVTDNTNEIKLAIKKFKIEFIKYFFNDIIIKSDKL